MNIVVELAAHRPHESGTAGCRACKYHFVLVVPVARERGGQECPRCGEFEVFFETTYGLLDDSEDFPTCLREYTRENE